MTSPLRNLRSPRLPAPARCPAPTRAAARTWAARAALVTLGAITGALVAPACGGKKGPPPDLVVASFAPTDYTDEPSPVIRLQFNQPAVDESAVGAPVEAELVRLIPQTPVTAHWVDRQTLVATPVDPLRPSTRYKVELRGDLAARTGGFSFSFVGRPLDVEAVRGGDLRNLPVEPELSIQFNQDVSPRDVAGRCALRPAGSGGGGDAVALKVAGDEPAPTLVLRPDRALTQGAEYTLRCEGLSGAGGDVPLAEPYELELRTYPVFTVASIEPDGNAIPADDVELKIRFATPVDLDTVRQHIAVSPAVPGFQRGWLDATGTLYRAVASLETETEYTVTVDEALTDVYEQKLPRSWTHEFRTSDAEPRVFMETGIYAVEAGLDGYGVWSRNVPSFRVECARVSKAAVARVLTAGIRFSTYEYYGDDDDAGIEWKKLGLAKRDAYVEVPAAKNKWHQSKLQPGELCSAGGETGLYLMQVGADEREGKESISVKDKRVLANVTELGVMAKVGPASGVIWVTSIATGAPVGGARVTIYGVDGKAAHAGTTDASGLLRVPGTAALFPPKQRSADERQEYYGYRSQRFVAVVEKGADMAVLDTNWDDGIETWNFGVSRDYGGGATKIRGFIQSDRGIYRPGETAHFKGLAREIAIGAPPRVPRKGPVRVEVTSSRGSKVLESKVELSRFGGFSFDVPLEAEAALGDYRVTATIGDQTFYESFSVEEFRKVSFELSLDRPARDEPGGVGEQLDFTLKADYLFGAPVIDGDVKWSVERRRHHLSFPAFRRFSFRDWAAQGRYDWWQHSHEGYSSFVASGAGKTDKQGKLAFSFRDLAKDADGPQDYNVEVTVTDQTSQSVSTRASITAHQTDRYLGVRATSWVQSTDEPLSFETVALTSGGQQVAATAELSLIREYYKCDYADGARSYPTCKTRRDLVTKRSIQIPASGPGLERLEVDRPGEYVVRIEGTDTRGNAIAASTYAWVVGKGGSWWSRDESSRFTLIASKDSYEPGDTAVLVPRVSMDNAHALVTLERDGVMDAFVTPLASASEGIHVPLASLHAPNVFASVTLVSGRTGPEDHARPRLKMGIIDLKVSSARKQLDVVIATDKPTYEPGEKVTGTVKITAGGKPVVAEVSVSAADEGVLQVIGFRTPDPMKAFYTPWSLGVNGSANWGKIARPTEPSNYEYEWGADYGGESDGGGGSSRVRTRFVSSAFWAPALVTNAAGEARFEFTAPDNLTAFRIMGVAADAGDMFGSSEHRITIKKPLLAKPILPRFFTAGDQARVGVMVHNYTGAAGEATVTGKATGARLSNPTQTVKVERDGSARVLFTATAGFDAKAELQFEVKLGGHADAFALPVPINRPYVITKRTLASGVLGGDAQGQAATAAATEVEQSMAVDADVVRGDSAITVSVDRTGLSELEPALRYLIEYPYGCLEQTLSRFIPLTKVKDLARSLGLKGLDGDELASFLRAGAAKVVRHQKYDGHFSLWPDSQPEPHLTVYAIYGLTEAKRAKVRIDERALSRGVEAMKEWVSSSQRTLGPGGETATVAMAAYLLAELGKPDHGLNARLYEVRAGLPRYGQAFLLQALHAAGAAANREQIAALVGELTSGARTDGGGAGETAVIPETEVEPQYWSTDTRTTAIALSALLRADPGHALVEKLARGLVKAQRPGGAWYNTQENLYALVALADYARRRTAGKATVEVYVDGKREVRRVMTGGNALVMRRSLHSAKDSVKVVSVDGRVRYALRLTEARKDPAAAPVTQGFTVAREYLDPKTEQPLQRFRLNQLVKVRVTVRADEGQHYVAVVDALPAGFEAVNTRLATSERGVDEEEDDDDYDWEPPTWTHLELRDDRAMAFADRMTAGEHQLEYLARATTAGTFAVLPATAEAMYDPDVFGRTAAGKITIAP